MVSVCVWVGATPWNGSHPIQSPAYTLRSRPCECRPSLLCKGGVAGPRTASCCGSPHRLCPRPTTWRHRGRTSIKSAPNPTIGSSDDNHTIVQKTKEEVSSEPHKARIRQIHPLNSAGMNIGTYRARIRPQHSGGAWLKITVASLRRCRCFASAVASVASLAGPLSLTA